MHRVAQLMSKTPSWVALVAIFPAIGLVLGLLSWAVSSAFPGVDQDAVMVVTFLLGMAMGGVAMPVWLSWHWERKARR